MNARYAQAAGPEAVPVANETDLAEAADAPPRVMMIAPHFEEYALRLSGALSRDSSVMLATDLGRLHRDFEDRPLADSRTGALKMIDARFRHPLDGIRLLGDVLRFRPSVIHLQEPSGTRKAMICAALVMLVRPFCRIALTVHDPEPHDGRDNAIAQRLDPFRQFIRRSAATVFVHGDYCRRRYEDVREREDQRIVVIDHGEILIDAPPTPLSETPLSILCFGRMEAYKGLDVFHQALEILADEGLAPDVLVAGRGPELDRLEEDFAALDNVAVENRFVTSRRLIEAIREADCVVMPYLEATQSGVLAAAIANGRFVIASRVGGIPDIVVDGENGLLVPPGDPRALAGAIRRVLDDRALRARLALGARKTGEQRLKWEQIAPKLLSHY